MNEKIKKLREEAVRLWGEEKWDKLIQVATEIISSTRESYIQAEAHYMRGYAYQNKQNKVAHALEDHTKAIELNPNFADAYCLRGFAHRNRGENEHAFEDSNTAINLDPDFADAYCLRGFTYLKKGKYNLAFEDANKAIELNPNFADAYCLRGFAHWGKGENERAFEDSNTAINLKSNLSEAYYLRGFFYCQKGEYERAFKDSNTAINLKSNLAVGYRLRADIYSSKREFDLAIKNYNKMLEINPKDSYAYLSRGIIYVRDQEYELALDDFNKTIKYFPSAKFYHPLIYIASQILAIDNLKKDQQIKALEIYSELFISVGLILQELFYSEELKVAHYTSLHILKNLSQRKSLFRFYNADHMNDQKEGEIFSEIMEEYQSIDINKLFYKYKDESYLSPAYIGSFVIFEKGDEQKGELTSWQTYGRHDNAEASGACLIFKTRECFAKNTPLLFGSMEEHSKITQKNLALYKIHYQGYQNKKLEIKLKKLGNQLINTEKFVANEVQEENIQDKFRRVICQLLDTIRFLFKARCYRNEEEVRVIQLRYGEKDKSSESEIKPDMDSTPPRFYIEAPRELRFSEVMLGPKAVDVRQWKKWYKVQDEDIKVYKSKIDYGNL